MCHLADGLAWRAKGVSTASYKRKDELIVLAGAFELDTTGTILRLALKGHIKVYVDSHKNWDGNLSGDVGVAGPSRLM